MKPLEITDPKPRDFGWVLKPVASARHTIQRCDRGHYEITIRHSILRGIDLAMLQWWFSSFFGLSITMGGERYPAYQVWHPLDHVAAVKIGGSKGSLVREGDTIRIHEYFQRRRAFEVNTEAYVFYGREDGFGILVRRGRLPVMRLFHRFEAVEGGVACHTKMIVGLEAGIFRLPVNRWLLPREFGEEKMRAWCRHNVEEVGCLENFLALAYARRHQGTGITLSLPPPPASE